MSGASNTPRAHTHARAKMALRDIREERGPILFSDDGAAPMVASSPRDDREGMWGPGSPPPTPVPPQRGDAGAGAGPSQAPAYAPPQQLPPLCPVDDMKWMFAPERLRASDIDLRLVDASDPDMESDPTFCYMCSESMEASKLEAMQELARIAAAYRSMSEQMTVTMMQQYYNASVRPLTRKNWSIDQVRAHITRHWIDHDTQVVSDIRSLIAVDDHLSRHLIQRDENGGVMPASRSDVLAWLKVKETKAKFLARLGGQQAVGAGPHGHNP